MAHPAECTAGACFACSCSLALSARFSCTAAQPWTLQLGVQAWPAARLRPPAAADGAPPASTTQRLRGPILRKVEQAAGFVQRKWKRDLMLGGNTAQTSGYVAVVKALHELPTYLAHLTLALHAMNAPLIKVRQGPLTSSFGIVFFHFAKTNKSAMNGIIDEVAPLFEAFVNQAELERVRAGEISKEEADFTYTYVPGATPQELFAQCDADRPGRKSTDVLHGHDEIAVF